MPKLPSRYVDFFERFPEVGRSYKNLGQSVKEAGPLDTRTQALIKLGIAVGARMEGAVHSHTRKCLEAGVSAQEIRHAVLQATTTLGFPSMMAAMSWVDDVLNIQESKDD